MNYWWVNHKQTVRAEIGEGYLWSPKTNKDGSRNEAYLNLQRVNAGDLVFSYANGSVGAVGVVRTRALESMRPKSFGKSGEQWAPVGWLVPVHWIPLADPIRPKDHLSEIAPLLPSRYSPIGVGGAGHQKFYLVSISEELASLLLSYGRQLIPILEDEVGAIRDDVLDDLEETRIQQQSADPLEIVQLIKARRGQGKFRSNLELIESTCRVTGVGDKRFLIASHIKPWRHSDNQEKLNGHNGLLLSPHVDRLFDRGWISFKNDGKLLVVRREVESLMRLWRLDPSHAVGPFSYSQSIFLDYHRDVVFKGPTSVAND